MRDCRILWFSIRRCFSGKDRTNERLGAVSDAKPSTATAAVETFAVK
jgi:hypothetical protein